MQEFPRSEILHIRIDYRSYWYRDRLGRWTYGVWGASGSPRSSRLSVPSTTA